MSEEHDLISFSKGILDKNPDMLIEAAFDAIIKEKDKAEALRLAVMFQKHLLEHDMLFSVKVKYIAGLNDLYLDIDEPDNIIILEEERLLTPSNILTHRGGVEERLIRKSHRCFDWAMGRGLIRADTILDACHPEDTFNVKMNLLQFIANSRISENTKTEAMKIALKHGAAYENEGCFYEDAVSLSIRSNSELSAIFLLESGDTQSANMRNLRLAWHRHMPGLVEKIFDLKENEMTEAYKEHQFDNESPGFRAFIENTLLRRRHNGSDVVRQPNAL